MDRLPALLRRLDFLANQFLQKTTWPISPSPSTTSMTQASTKVYQAATAQLLLDLRHRQCLSLHLRIPRCHAPRMALPKSPASRSTWTTLLILRTIDLHNLSYLLPGARCPLVRIHPRYHRSRLIWIRALLQMILLVQLHWQVRHADRVLCLRSGSTWSRAILQTILLVRLL